MNFCVFFFGFLGVHGEDMGKRHNRAQKRQLSLGPLGLQHKGHKMSNRIARRDY